MKKIVALLTLIAMAGLPAFAQKDENNRIRNAGEVMVAILNVPDDIPQDLLDKAECVIVMPSVKKFAFGIGGSYGRGIMTCRSGENFTGPWSAPTMMALEGGSFGFQLGGQSTDFVLLVMNRDGAKSILNSRVKLGVTWPLQPDPWDATLRPQRISRCEHKFFRTLDRAVCLPGFLLQARRCVLTTRAMRNSTAKELAERISSSTVKFGHPPQRDYFCPPSTENPQSSSRRLGNSMKLV